MIGQHKTAADHRSTSQDSTNEPFFKYSSYDTKYHMRKVLDKPNPIIKDDTT
ncbi:hypothetical protein [Bartonella sp. OD88NMGDW]|uniref:hypothetical protein n=1 Tax=Bartonella sp. OD88NMGDW TaxID=3243571 RepID=UPI0035CFBF7A